MKVVNWSLTGPLKWIHIHIPIIPSILDALNLSLAHLASVFSCRLCFPWPYLVRPCGPHRRKTAAHEVTLMYRSFDYMTLYAVTYVRTCVCMQVMLSNYMWVNILSSSCFFFRIALSFLPPKRLSITEFFPLWFVVVIIMWSHKVYLKAHAPPFPFLPHPLPLYYYLPLILSWWNFYNNNNNIIMLFTLFELFC